MFVWVKCSRTRRVCGRSGSLCQGHSFAVEELVYGMICWCGACHVWLFTSASLLTFKGLPITKRSKVNLWISFKSFGANRFCKNFLVGVFLYDSSLDNDAVINDDSFETSRFLTNIDHNCSFSTLEWEEINKSISSCMPDVHSEMPHEPPMYLEQLSISTAPVLAPGGTSQIRFVRINLFQECKIYWQPCPPMHLPKKALQRCKHVDVCRLVAPRNEVIGLWCSNSKSKQTVPTLLILTVF